MKAFASSAVPILRVKHGGTWRNVPLNGGVPLATSGGTFTWSVRSDREYNLRHDQAGAVTLVEALVEEITGGVV